jgi:integrase
MAIGPAWREHDLIFPSALGTPLDPDNVSHWFSRICRRAGLGHWHLHELRHSGASLMLAQGTDLYVSRRLRRLRIETTFETTAKNAGRPDCGRAGVWPGQAGGGGGI